MLAAVGNKVVGLHRSQIGAMPLPAELAPGKWRWISEDELKLLATNSLKAT
jgi:16S rRNA pseudouridine516 synthase